MGELLACALSPQTTLDLIIGFVLIVGIVVSYAPQWVAFVRRKSSDSISFWMLLIGSINNFASVANGLMLQYDRFQCCIVTWTGWQCVENIFAIAQIGTQWSCFVPIFVLALYYHKAETQAQRMLPRILFSITIFFYGAVILIGTVFIHQLGPRNATTLGFANALGYLSAIGTLFQWTPQIYRTFKDRSVGALSIPMLLIQCPGSAIFVYFQAGPQHEDWTTYLPYVVAAMQQFVLLCMCLVLTCRERLRKKPSVVYVPTEDGEAQHLLGPDFIQHSLNNDRRQTASVRTKDDYPTIGSDTVADENDPASEAYYQKRYTPFSSRLGEVLDSGAPMPGEQPLDREDPRRQSTDTDISATEAVGISEGLPTPQPDIGSPLLRASMKDR